MKKINMDISIPPEHFSRVLEKVTTDIQKIENDLSVELDFEINVVFEDYNIEYKENIENKNYKNSNKTRIEILKLLTIITFSVLGSLLANIYLR